MTVRYFTFEFEDDDRGWEVRYGFTYNGVDAFHCRPQNLSETQRLLNIMGHDVVRDQGSECRSRSCSPPEIVIELMEQMLFAGIVDSSPTLFILNHLSKMRELSTP